MGALVRRDGEVPSKVRESTPIAGQIFVDFDGTIAIDDTTQLLLDQFAHPSWREVEERWEAGEIGSRECLSKQIDLLHVCPQELDAALDTVTIDRSFSELVGFARCNRMKVTVISDGLDRSVLRILDRMKTHVTCYANKLEWLGGCRWRLDFPHWRVHCRSVSGHCKCATIASTGSQLSVLIGDGRSDFCAAQSVDLICAKGRLANYCKQNSLPYHAFNDLAQTMDVIASVVDEQRAFVV